MIEQRYSIRDGYTARPTPAYFEDTRPDGKHWQCDVISIAVHLARANGATRLIDVGCGRGMGLMPYAREFDVLGIDYGSNLAHCKSAYEWGTWIECDLETDMPDVDWQLFKRSVVICADVIEHLVTPDYLLATLMSAVCCAEYAVISTPDRAQVYGYDHDGPPGNLSHVREWTLDELTALLESCGLGIAWRGWTLSNNVDRLKNTCLVVCTRRDKCRTLNLETVFDVEVRP